eukprot:4754415-Pleurochrysis_carterae.AAC.1
MIAEEDGPIVNLLGDMNMINTQHQCVYRCEIVMQSGDGASSLLSLFVVPCLASTQNRKNE